MTGGVLSRDPAGLSYCRHMRKVHHMVAHMVDASVPVQLLNPAKYKEGILEESWAEFKASRTVSYIPQCRVCVCVRTVYV